MEWTKEKLIGTCIKCKNKKHGKRIIEFYKSHGFNVHDNTGKCNRFYYGIVVCSNLFACFETKKYFSKEIKLPSKPRRKFPREMMVSDDGMKWERKTIAGKVKSEIPYVSYIAKEDLNAIIGIPYPRCWKYAKEID